MIENTSGAVFINKPSGITSYKSLDTIKRKLATRKIGHTGTLDKFASGVMIVLTGKMTKLAGYFTGLDKDYEAVFSFGKETATLDPEGEVIAESGIPDLATIREKVKSFKGIIRQVPPAYSAIHINGKRAHEIARGGGTPDITEREVAIYTFQILSWKTPDLTVRIKCSKGTYIRSIARDLGRSCGSYAYVTSLKRTAVGKIRIEDTIDSNELDPENDIVRGKNLFSLLPDLQILSVNREIIPGILNGKKLDVKLFPGMDLSYPRFALFHEDDFVALISREMNRLKYNFVSGDLYGSYLG
ncbi:MAG: tRNA pseudouridine(55) synthase TruB [Spirochaetes bacterium]|nr:MAG: tRNA pseudouridine(55) synthase TruB [Spirochaetota bacterium]